MLVRVTTATPEHVGTLVIERAMAVARVPSQCEPKALRQDRPVQDACGSDGRAARSSVATPRTR